MEGQVYNSFYCFFINLVIVYFISVRSVISLIRNPNSHKIVIVWPSSLWSLLVCVYLYDKAFSSTTSPAPSSKIHYKIIAQVSNLFVKTISEYGT